MGSRQANGNDKLTIQQVLLRFIKLAAPNELVRLKYLAEQELLLRTVNRIEKSRQRRFGPHEADGNAKATDGEAAGDEEVDGNVKQTEGE